MKKSIKDVKSSKENTIYNQIEDLLKNQKSNRHMKLYIGKELFERWNEIFKEEFKNHNKL